ncbi:MAG: NUDIX domain-containing protein [Alphaproteobacteria bacterium]|nr:NUDIX domain-containing protein [Alphaproteobacteria bacterium]MCB9797525.1 NUDIX domain-containing protein [Alphaproteobacteria bacterium]
MAVAPRPASTVVLLRDSPSGPECFMVQRSARSVFMPNAHVFPGGRVDPDDQRLSAQGGEADIARMGTPDAAAYMVAAVRECFEETGVLLAQGEPLPGDREAVHANEALFSQRVQERGWVLDLDRLRYWAWWITPEAEARRYDTRFFIAKVEGGDEARHDEHETVQSAWWTVAGTLARFEAGEVQLAPPTYITLLQLAPYATVDAALDAAGSRQVVPIMPRGQMEPDGALTVLLPGDPAFPSEHPVEGPTRITLRKGRWFVHR